MGWLRRILCRLRLLSLRFRLVLFVTFGVLLTIHLCLRSVSREKQRVYITNQIKFALGSRNASEQVKVGIDTTILKSRFRGGRYKPEQMLAVVVITSHPEEIEERANIRIHWQKWDLQFQQNIQRIFFVGQPSNQRIFDQVASESHTHGDIVVDNMQESYYALTLKTLRILKWFLFSFSNVKFLVKSDLDTFIHLPNLINYLHSVIAQGPHIAGRFVGGELVSNAIPYENPTEKWYMPKELLDPNYMKSDKAGSLIYPDYIQGAFYIISSGLIPALYNKSNSVPLIQFEDIYLTGMVANKGLGLTLTHIQNVYCGYYFKYPHEYFFTSYHDDSLIANHFHGDLNAMYKYYKHFQK